MAFEGRVKDSAAGSVEGLTPCQDGARVIEGSAAATFIFMGLELTVPEAGQVACRLNQVVTVIGPG